MGFTFKENCSDIRNSRVMDLMSGFKKYKTNIDVYDPWVDKKEVLNIYNFKVIKFPKKNMYDAIIIVVVHDEFKKITSLQLKSFGKTNSIIYDIKYLLNDNIIDGRI